jgi:hypothetical protein
VLRVRCLCVCVFVGLWVCRWVCLCLCCAMTAMAVSILTVFVCSACVLICTHLAVTGVYFG